MTPDQFQALATLLQLRAGPAQQAAYLVMVDKLRLTDAAALAGVSQPAASNALKRARAGLALAQAACGLAQEK